MFMSTNYVGFLEILGIVKNLMCFLFSSFVQSNQMLKYGAERGERNRNVNHNIPMTSLMCNANVCGNNVAGETCSR